MKECGRATPPGQNRWSAWLKRHDADLVLVLRAARLVLLQRGERAALRARLGAGVQLAQLHEVAVLDQVLAGQAGHHRALLQEAVAFWEGAADAGAGATHLQQGGRKKVKQIIYSYRCC